MALLLSNGQPFTLKQATDDEFNILHRLRTVSNTAAVKQSVWSQRATVAAICATHLRLPTGNCSLEPMKNWTRGRFNLCVLVRAEALDGSVSRKVFRCPLPHKVGDSFQPGASEDKTRAEAANYAWIEEYCPEVPIPKLIGFGFADGYQFTHERSFSWPYQWFRRASRAIRRFLGLHPPSRFVRERAVANFEMPYLFLDWIEREHGTMLSEKWVTGSCALQKPEKLKNLYRGISRVMLSLARVPQPCIGSFRFEDDGRITLSQPPLLCTNTILESEGVPRVLRAPVSYTGHFASLQMDFRDQALRTQQHAAFDKDDCILQMSHHTNMRVVMPHLIDVYYGGPFVLQHTDLHASNLFVDDDWNIVGVIDLEFLCSLPPDMIEVPYWLTVKEINLLSMENHDRTHRDFMRIFEEEEKKLIVVNDRHPLSSSVKDAWYSGAAWFWYGIQSINGITSLMEARIWPIFGCTESVMKAEVLAHFFTKGADDFVEEKLKDRRQYDEELRTQYQQR